MSSSPNVYNHVGKPLKNMKCEWKKEYNGIVSDYTQELLP